MDPFNTSRRHWTKFLVSQPLPANASPNFGKLWTDTNDLVEKLSQHEVMECNLDGMVAEPVYRKSKIYFMWDYVLHTRTLMEEVDPANPRRSVGGSFKNIITRSKLTASLVDDQDSPLDEVINEPDDRGTEFGPEIVKIAKEIGRLSQSFES